ncbi:hypothetical protein MC885_007373 [Smutsia gigantea]|nr:hypothetical protein MC885_007373 [Smutsia gigantea]
MKLLDGYQVTKPEAVSHLEKEQAIVERKSPSCDCKWSSQWSKNSLGVKGEMCGQGSLGYHGT